MKATRTPAWLLTGDLGSGKTTLLRAWLRDPALANAAVIVNEIGEVGLDDRLLVGAVDRAALLANQCVCCTGLPGLEEALSELWWDRLQRRRPAFDAVVIETTGLADPAPIVEAFAQAEFLRQRYALAGVLTTVSASAGAAPLERHPEVAAQVAAADLLVVTKVDRADAAALRPHLRALNAGAAILPSAQGSLTWPDAAAAAQGRRARARTPADAAPVADARPAHHHHDQRHDHHHAHAVARFVALPDPVAPADLAARLSGGPAGVPRRAKGVVRLDDGRLVALHWAAGDAAPSLEPFDGTPPTLGLTVIGG